jgi:ribonuclease HII
VPTGRDQAGPDGSAAALWRYERTLWRRGLGPVVGVDEAGRGACAGPLVTAAVALPARPSARLRELADSKLLSPPVRERVYDQIMKVALTWTAVVVPPAELDAMGLHRANIEGLRRAVAALETSVGYVLTDGFPVPGLPAATTAIIKGDRVSASVAAASVVAKVTRDRIMTDLHERYPEYDFAQHKGYVTAGHTAALTRFGPSDVHRLSFVNVARARRGSSSRLEDTVGMSGLDRATESA